MEEKCEGFIVDTEQTNNFVGGSWDVVKFPKFLRLKISWFEITALSRPGYWGKIPYIRSQILVCI